MERIALGISLVNGRFKAVSLRKGAIVGAWDGPAVVEDSADLPAILNEAISQTKAEGRSVSVVLSHPRFSHHLVEVPPARGWTLERYLNRRAQHLKTFEGEALWSRQPALAARNANAVLLHLFPKERVDRWVSTCAQAHLQLARLVPATAILSRQLKELPLEKDEVALLAAETGSTTTVVIGSKDGRVCLTRILPGSWNQQMDRLGVDITRTIGFAEQRGEVAVNRVWLFGAGAKEAVPALQALLDLPVSVSPVESTPFYWAVQAANLSEIDDGNLISLEARQAPRRRRLLTMTGLILLLVLFVSLGTAGYIEKLRRDAQHAIARVDADIAKYRDSSDKLRQQKHVWQQRRAELARKQELVRIVNGEKLPPVPTWFLSYLSEAVPDDLLLADLHVTRTNGLWSVYVAGAGQPTTNESPSLEFHRACAALTNGLSTGPFRLTIKTNAVWAEDGATNRFVLEGTIR